jgi:hypothetical protein
MKRPPFEVADIIRAHGNSFLEKNRSWLTWLHLRVLFAIEHCRTAAIGGHLDRCRQCGHEAVSFNSCRSRHCPKCQTNARDKWLTSRSKELLPVKYVHVVFTIPHELSWLALHNKKVVYDLLFRASATTLLEVAVDQTSWCRDRVPQRPSYLGTESSASSASPLCDSLWRSLSRSPRLGSSTLRLLPAGEGTWPRISRQIHRRTQERLLPWETTVSWKLEIAR